MLKKTNNFDLLSLQLNLLSAQPVTQWCVQLVLRLHCSLVDCRLGNIALIGLGRFSANSTEVRRQSAGSVLCFSFFCYINTYVSANRQCDLRQCDTRRNCCIICNFQDAQYVNTVRCLRWYLLHSSWPSYYYRYSPRKLQAAHIMIVNSTELAITWFIIVGKGQCA